MNLNTIDWSDKAMRGDFRTIVAEALTATDEQLKDTLAFVMVGPMISNADAKANSRDYAIRQRMQRALVGVIETRLYPGNYVLYGPDDFAESFGRPEDFVDAGFEPDWCHVRITAVNDGELVTAVQSLRREARHDMSAKDVMVMLKDDLPVNATQEPMPRDEAKALIAKLEGMTVEIVKIYEGT